jgi:GT2 family glycosyltransferase
VKRKLLVVIPVFGHVDIALECARSVIASTRAQTTRVVLINDRGPESDDVTRVLRREVSKSSGGFEIVTNSRNLGLVGSLNTFLKGQSLSGTDVLIVNSDVSMAADSIAEMQRILHAVPRTGIVCPRSNNASIASVDGLAAESVESATASFTSWSRSVAESTLVPVAVGFCMLVRGELFDEFGYFDPIYSPGYGEENDFSYRIRRGGWNVRLANHAFAFHIGRASFGSERGEILQLRNEFIFRFRYPMYTFDIDRYRRSAVGPSAVSRPAERLVGWIVSFAKQLVFILFRPMPTLGARLVLAVRRALEVRP